MYQKQSFRKSMSMFIITLMVVLGLSSPVWAAKCQNGKGNAYGHLRQKLDSYLQQETDVKILNGSVLVAKDGKILIKKGYGIANFEEGIQNTSRTVHRIASLTKAFTSLSIMMLEERGLLRVEDTVDKYIPEYPHAHEMTIHNLLTHTSGVYPYLRDWDSGAWDNIGNFHTPQDIMDYVLDQPLTFPVGTGFEYSNSNYVLLGVIIERLTGMTYRDFIEENIFRPLHMKSTSYDPYDSEFGLRHSIGYDDITVEPFVVAPYLHPSMAYAAFGCSSTVVDLYKWDQSLYTDRLVSMESLEKIFTPYTSTPPFTGQYAYGWFIDTLEINSEPHKHVWHTGGYLGYLCSISRLVDDNVTIILVLNTTPPNFVDPVIQKRLIKGITDIVFESSSE